MNTHISSPVVFHPNSFVHRHFSSVTLVSFTSIRPVSRRIWGYHIINFTKHQMPEICFAYLGQNLPFLNYLNLGNTTKSVTKIIVVTGIAHFKHPPKKNTTKPHFPPSSNHHPSIPPFLNSCGTPMAPSRNTWLKRIIASLSPLSADNFHHFTASLNLADWRKSSPKNLRSPGAGGWWVFCWGGTWRLGF